VRWQWLLVLLFAACEPGAATRPWVLQPASQVRENIRVGSQADNTQGEVAGDNTQGRVQGRVPAEPPKPPRPGVFANTDPDDDFVVGPPDAVEGCEEELRREGVTFHRATLQVHEIKKSHIVCGAPQVVTYFRGPGRITYNAPPLLTCRMALALAWFEKLLQEEAKVAFKSTVARVDHVGTYSCREIAAYPGWVSEHSYANAIDLSRFVLADGRTIEVRRDFDIGEAPPKKPAAAFLRTISRRAHDEDMFSHVLTPFFNAQHSDHFHLDLARYRNDGTRPRL
jgi:hypothetical protein